MKTSAGWDDIGLWIGQLDCRTAVLLALLIVALVWISAVIVSASKKS